MSQSDTTEMDNLRAADITSSVAGTFESEFKLCICVHARNTHAYIPVLLPIVLYSVYDNLSMCMYCMTAIAGNNATSNVRGGHSVHTASDPTNNDTDTHDYWGSGAGAPSGVSVCVCGSCVGMCACILKHE